jgi:hypothetical protein
MQDEESKENNVKKDHGTSLAAYRKMQRKR